MAISPPRVFLSGEPRDPRPVWLLLQGLCVVGIVLSAVGVVANLFEVLAPSAFEAAFASSLFFDAYFFLGYGNWIAALLTFGALLWLTYRLARNLHALARGRFSMSPTYAMAWYLVPFANIFMPPRVVDAISEATHAAAGAAQRSRTLPGWWWAACVVAALLSNAAAAVVSQSGAFDAETAFDSDAYEAALWISSAAGILAIAGAWLTIHLFGPIAGLQSALVQSRASQSA